MPNLYDFSVTTIDGCPQSLGELHGQVVLAVNVASLCVFTQQYAGLEQLYREFADCGLTVLGFPCDQFGHQEPGDNASIQYFCATRYDVSFPLFSKLDVNGPNQHPLFDWMTGDDAPYPGPISWNFEKFLIGRDGLILRRYPPRVDPDDFGLRRDVLDALSGPLSWSVELLPEGRRSDMQ